MCRVCAVALLEKKARQGLAGLQSKTAHKFISVSKHPVSENSMS